MKKHLFLLVALVIGTTGSVAYAGHTRAIGPVSIVSPVTEPSFGSGGQVVDSSSSGITSLGGLTGATQTFVDDTNVTMTSSGTTHTLGWTGVAASSRIAASAASSTVLTTDGTTNRWYTGISLDKLTISGTGTSTVLTGALSSAGILSSVGLTITGGNISTASTDLTIQPGQNKNTLLNPEGGNVGIGSSTPGSPLAIQGSANFKSAATSTIYTPLILPNFTATSTVATSTFEGSVLLAHTGGIAAVGTTTATSTPGSLVVGKSVVSCLYTITPAATITVDWSLCNNQRVILSQAGHTVTFINGVPGQQVSLDVYQDSTGGRTITSWTNNPRFRSSNTTTTATSTPGMTTKPDTGNLFSWRVTTGTSSLIYAGGLPLKDY